jgi:hypothetical protein
MCHVDVSLLHTLYRASVYIYASTDKRRINVLLEEVGFEGFVPFNPKFVRLVECNEVGQDLYNQLIKERYIHSILSSFVFIVF